MGLGREVKLRVVEDPSRPMLEAIHNDYRTEIAKLKMQLVVYREALIENGIEPPDKEGADLMEMYKRCRAVISTASEFVGVLRSAHELLR